ncbi:hypothetical protein [Eubacterium sp. AM46-8]|nr:hypothetical protein [Eubacterium sp. AM46-8]
MGGELAYRYSAVLAEVLEEDEKKTLDTSDYFMIHMKRCIRV